MVVLGGDLKDARLLQRYLDGCRLMRVSDTIELHLLITSMLLHALLLTSQTKSESWWRELASDPLPSDLPLFTCSLRTPAGWLAS